VSGAGCAEQRPAAGSSVNRQLTSEYRGVAPLKERCFQYAAQVIGGGSGSTLPPPPSPPFPIRCCCSETELGYVLSLEENFARMLC